MNGDGDAPLSGEVVFGDQTLATIDGADLVWRGACGD
jgi:hypothetical protein